MFKAFIFDLDGTLADTLPDFADALNETLRSYGYPERTYAEIESFIGNGQRMLVKRSLPEGARDEATVDVCERLYAKKYAENLAVRTKLYPGIYDVLTKLKSNGARIGVISNKAHEHVVTIVNIFFGDTFFDIVLGAGPFARKPEPDSALFVAKNFGLSPSECVFVGDSDVDIKTAKNAGMFALGVSWGYRKREVLLNANADAVIDDTAALAGYM